MCEICRALGLAPNEHEHPIGDLGNEAGSSGITGFQTQFKDHHQANMLALIGSSKWSETSLTYSFPDATLDYTGAPSSYGSGELTAGFAQLAANQQEAANRAFDMISAYTGMTFAEVTGPQGTADIRLATSNVPTTAWAYYPSSNSVGGDAWFNGANGYYGNPKIGTYGFHTFMHELGHSIGLKHGHDNSGYGSLDAAHDQMAFSVMTYKSHTGSTGASYSNEYYGYAQTYMAYDIAAFQALYGVDWDTEAGDSTYTFSQTTGEMSINGVGQGAAGSNRIFRTIWDGNGNDTIDLSNYGNDVTGDMAPGQYLDFSAIQTAQLAAGVYADGNVYFALAPNGKKQAMIENIITGSGEDSIRGNKADNTIDLGGKHDEAFGMGGDDVLLGGGGRDRLIGGPGDDRLDGGIGRDWLKGAKGADVFVLNETSSKDIVLDFELGVDLIDVPDNGLASLGVSNTGHLTVEYADAMLILRHLDPGDALLVDLLA